MPNNMAHQYSHDVWALGLSIAMIEYKFDDEIFGGYRFRKCFEGL